MKKVNLILLALIVIAGMSCSGDKDKKQSKKREGSFDKVYSVTGEEILKEEYNVLSLYFIDKYLLASLRNTDEYFFTLYDLATNKKVMNLFPYGNGPGEFSSGYSYQHYEKEDGKLYVWIHDYQRFKLIKIDITRSVEENKTVIDKVVKTGTRDSFFVDMYFGAIFYLDSTKLVGTTSNLSLKMKRFVVYNPIEDTIIKAVAPFPEVKYDFTKKDEGYGRLMYIYNQLYIAGLGMKPDESLFASAMSMFNRLDIFDANGNVTNSYVDDDNISENLIKEYLSSNLDNVSKVPVKNYYADVSVTDRFIYALYQNRLDSAWRTSVPVKVRIFNWKAEPVCTIDIPDFLQHISVDENNGILYGCAYTDEKILKYDIKGIIDKISK